MLTMNYVTTNATYYDTARSFIMPSSAPNTINNIGDPYTYYDSVCGLDLPVYNPLRDIHTNSPEERSKAAKAICEMGYITKEEAERLVDGIVRRNDYTVIHLEEFPEIIIVSCYEDDPSATQSKVKLFQLVYTKSSGKVDVVGQEYLLD